MIGSQASNLLDRGGIVQRQSEKADVYPVNAVVQQLSIRVLQEICEIDCDFAAGRDRHQRFEQSHDL